MNIYLPKIVWILIEYESLHNQILGNAPQINFHSDVRGLNPLLNPHIRSLSESVPKAEIITLALSDRISSLYSDLPKLNLKA